MQQNSCGVIFPEVMNNARTIEQYKGYRIYLYREQSYGVEGSCVSVGSLEAIKRCIDVLIRRQREYREETNFTILKSKINE